MPIQPRPQSSWATPEDWCMYRELITRLYWDERKPLKQVAESMSREHGFHATTRMYKSRFKQWGLVKNLSSQDRNRITKQAVLDGRTDLPIIRGRPPGAKRFHNLLHRIATARNPRKRLTSPEYLRIPEESLAATIEWASGRMENNLFGVNSDNYDWFGDVGLQMWRSFHAAVEFSTPAEPVIDLPLLNKALSEYSCALDAAEPTLVWGSLLAVLKFAAKAGRALTKSFTSYVSSLCSIKLGPTHPLSRMWFTINSASMGQLMVVTPILLDAYLDCLKSEHQVMELFRKVSVIRVLWSLPQWSVLSVDSVSTRMQALVADLGDFRGQDNFSVGWYCWSRLQYCLFLMQAGKFAEADQALKEIPRRTCSQIGHGNPSDNGGLKCKRFPTDFHAEMDCQQNDQEYHVMCFYEQRARSLESRGLVDESTTYWVAAFERDRAEGTRATIARAAKNLVTHYQRKGNPRLAEKVRCEAQRKWEALV